MQWDSEWCGVAVAFGTAVWAGIEAKLARRESREANRIAHQALELERERERREAQDREVQDEAESVLAEAKREWPNHVTATRNGVKTPARGGGLNVDAIAGRLRSGILVRREKPRQEVAVKISASCRATARIEGAGYRVILRFDKSTFELID